MGTTCASVLTAGMLGVLVAPTAAQEDFEAYREPVQALLADEASPDMEFPEKLRKVNVGPGEGWPAEGLAFFGLTAGGKAEEGYAVVDVRKQEVAGFAAGRPQPPVPMDAIPDDQAIEIATAFARRHAPELFADGGQVTTTVGEDISRIGARTVCLQRVVQGVNVPTFADVGVRVYDGKVVRFRRSHEPLPDGLDLPGSVTEDQAKEIATASLPAARLEPLFWFDIAHEISSEGGPLRNVWVLSAELRTKNAPDKPEVGMLRAWRIDANSAEVLSARPVKLDQEVWSRYRAAGGPRGRVQFHPEQMAQDGHPVWSPDGSKIAFLSRRARPGWPDWLETGPGLFTVNADGTDLKCLAPESAGEPRWSPDGEEIAYCSPRGMHRVLRIVAVAGGEVQEPTSPNGDSYVRGAWIDDRRVIAYADAPQLGSVLVLADLTQPEKPPTPLTPQGQYADVVVTPDGKSMIYTAYDFVSHEDTWDLLTLDLTQEGAEPQVISENPREGRGIQLLGGEKLFVWDSRPSTLGGEMFLVDLSTGEVEQWTPPRPSVPDLEHRNALEPDDVCFSPDGQRIAFSARVWDWDPERPPATLIWTSALDGSDLEQITPWDDALVPLAGE